MQHTVEQGIEHELRVLLVVAYLTTKRQALLALGKAEVDGIQSHIADVQRVYIAVAIDTRFWRGGHIKQECLEVNTLTFQDNQQRILTLTLHMYLHRRQQLTQGSLVDNLLGELR